ncbi:MAG TPA: LCP family protein [Acidimicrobiales bacterium]|nr:LCP family protein [Acidimicrobiales bacterium]
MTPDAADPPDSAETAGEVPDPGQADAPDESETETPGEAAAPDPPPAGAAGTEEPLDAVAILEASGRSRADLQAELRQSRKKEHKHQHRWRRRGIYALATIVLIAGLGAGGLYFYAKYRYDQIKKIHAAHLVAQAAAPGKPFNILVVGSDSRAFVGDNQTLTSELGNEADAGGQRSDVTMVARFDPANKTVTVLSIPRDLWVDIPGNDSGISGMNRINAAFDSGPDLLIQTIEQDLGIKINHYVAVNFPGFSAMVNALGGITMDFPTAVKDAYTGLDVTQTGCQVVNGTTALQLVRSRHLEYINQNGYWESDGLSDFSRIQRQDAFFRAVLAKANTSITNPFAINSFLGAAVGNLTIDDTLTQSDLLHLATDFHGLGGSKLVTETLPTTGFVTDGGADVLKEAQPYAQNLINAFNAIGAPPPTTAVANAKGAKAGTPTTTTTTLPHRQVEVDVLNASSGASTNGLAHLVAGALATGGFTINEIADAPSPLGTDTSLIMYGPSGYAAAQTLAADLGGPVTLKADSTMSSQTVELLVAGTALTVKPSTGNSGATGSTGSSGAGTTTTTAPSTLPTGPTTTTTIPSDVYANTQPEAWNPFPCTLGASTQAAPTTTTTKAKGKKG